MDIVQRVQSILLKPKEEWVKIKAEPTTVAGLFTSYIMILAAIPAVFQFLGHVLVGRGFRSSGSSAGRSAGLLGNAVVTYILSLVTVYLFALSSTRWPRPSPRPRT